MMTKSSQPTISPVKRGPGLVHPDTSKWVSYQVSLRRKLCLVDLLVAGGWRLWSGRDVRAHLFKLEVFCVRDGLQELRCVLWVAPVLDTSRTPLHWLELLPSLVTVSGWATSPLSASCSVSWVSFTASADSPPPPMYPTTKDGLNGSC
jgi:hypothetical protein